MSSLTSLITGESKKKVFLETIPEEPEEINESEKSNERNSSLIKVMKRNFYLRQFNLACSEIRFTPISCKENFSTNYDSYISTTLSHLAELKSLKINYSYALENPSIYENYPEQILGQITKNGNKKILLLDLDETLIHADFDELLPKSTYDKIITFTEKKSKEENDEINAYQNSQENNDTSDSSENEEEEIFKVGIFLRNGVREFLNIVSQYFEVGIFTASVKEYADAVIDFLDPEKKMIKFRLYRNNCVNVNDLFTTKDLTVIKGIDLRKVVLVDNNIYSFAPQINNGILINSFYNDKNDQELNNVLCYLMNYIYSANDVREINKKIFGFKSIIEQFEKKK